eukprot:scaffold16961_cov56-Cyclotella_meneghiniana.AAC.1
MAALKDHIGAAFLNSNPKPASKQDSDNHTTATASSESTAPSASTAQSDESPTDDAILRARRFREQLKRQPRTGAPKDDNNPEYNVPAAEEPPVSTASDRNHGIPLGTRSTLSSEDDFQYVDFSTYANHLGKVDPDAEVTAIEVADIMKDCVETMNNTLSVKIVRAVERPPVEGPAAARTAGLEGADDFVGGSYSVAPAPLDTQGSIRFRRRRRRRSGCIEYIGYSISRVKEEVYPLWPRLLLCGCGKERLLPVAVLKLGSYNDLLGWILDIEGPSNKHNEKIHGFFALQLTHDPSSSNAIERSSSLRSAIQQ